MNELLSPDIFKGKMSLFSSKLATLSTLGIVDMESFNSRTIDWPKPIEEDKSRDLPFYGYEIIGKVLRAGAPGVSECREIGVSVNGVDITFENGGFDRWLTGGNTNYSEALQDDEPTVIIGISENLVVAGIASLLEDGATKMTVRPVSNEALSVLAQPPEAPASDGILAA